MKEIFYPLSVAFARIPLLPRNCKGYENRKKATAKLIGSTDQPFNIQRFSGLEL
jgi:hypothetical protein